MIFFFLNGYNESGLVYEAARNMRDTLVPRIGRDIENTPNLD